MSIKKLKLVLGTVLLLIPLSYFVFKRLTYTEIPIRVEGEVRTGYEANPSPLTLPYLSTTDKAYYLIDETDSKSRKEKATKLCPEATISCFKGKRVKIDGYLTNKHKTISEFRLPRVGDAIQEKGEPFISQELVVLNFDVLD